MNKKKTDAVLNNQNQDLEEIEEDLTEEFIEKENKTAMQVHSVHLKNVPNMKSKRLKKLEGISDRDS